MDETVTRRNAPRRGLFKGQSNELPRLPSRGRATRYAAGNRTLQRFRPTVPTIPGARVEDDRTLTPRNSPPLVNASLARPDFLLHFDGQFSSGRASGDRHFDRPQLRMALGRRRRGPWRMWRGSFAMTTEPARWPPTTIHCRIGKLLRGEAEMFPLELKLPKAYRLDVDRATDAQIMNAVAKLINAYVASLAFSKAYPRHLQRLAVRCLSRQEQTPAKPAAGESRTAYSARLLRLAKALAQPKFVAASEGAFIDHTQDFVFGQSEFDGLKIFLSRPARPVASSAEISRGGIGNCAACHAPPNFTDFKFHNTSATQEEYDSIHGAGAFAALQIPEFNARRADLETWVRFIAATSLCRRTVSLDPGFTTSRPHRSRALECLCKLQINRSPRPRSWRSARRKACDQSTVAAPHDRVVQSTQPAGSRRFESLPAHTGRKDTIEEVIGFTCKATRTWRAPARSAMRLPKWRASLCNRPTIALLAAFLRSLTEDYNLRPVRKRSMKIPKDFRTRAMR